MLQQKVRVSFYQDRELQVEDLNGAEILKVIREGAIVNTVNRETPSLSVGASGFGGWIVLNDLMRQGKGSSEYLLIVPGQDELVAAIFVGMEANAACRVDHFAGVGGAELAEALCGKEKA